MTASQPSRRAVLLGAAGVAAGAAALEVPALGRAIHELPHERVPPGLPAGTPLPVRRGRFRSARRGRDVGWALARPEAAAPVVLVLHGRGGDAGSAFGDGLGLDRLLAEHLRLGGAPLAVASVDGGEAYWQPRASGDDPLGMLTAELLPLLRSIGLATDRIGVLGWSMGGYGALLLARESTADRLGGVRVGAAAASSPALFPTAGATSAGSFDGPADWRRWGDLVAHPQVKGVALSVRCGDSDPFAAQSRRYRAAVQPGPEGGGGPGRHDFAYWRAQVPAQLAFLGTHL